jgi:5-methylcytosine-specific restriction enzyme A
MSNRAEFSKATKLAAFERCKGRCECGCGFKIIGGVEYDHYPVPASLGGSNDLSNCRVLMKKHHRQITAEVDQPALSKSQRIYEKRAGVRKPKGRPFPKRPNGQQWGRNFE